MVDMSKLAKTSYRTSQLNSAQQTASSYRCCYIDLTTLPSLPSWKERPEEVLEVIRWARDNDAEAKRIAGNGQKFALE